MEKSLQILVIEDEFITQKTIINQLTEIGYRISGTAMSSDEAIEILENEIVNFAILDINIKGKKNGIWLANYIKENYSIPYIYLTAYSDDDTITKALKTDPYAYLVKPFQKTDLLTSIEISVQIFNKINQQIKENFLIIKHLEVYKKINLNSIRFIESDKNYLILNSSDTNYRYRATITEFTKQLPHCFIQTHKGFIVNINFITAFSNTLIEIENNKIPISKTHKDNVLRILTQ
ncbi:MULTISPECIES: response regulator [Flavobacterium]|uniref:Response regulator n=1 Tax=Flavobacterium jumunjinense TaxID=998845 RepID=A0ABV5GND7_9FLAO|nr:MULTISPECIES: response regulator [Flavobacterium]